MLEAAMFEHEGYRLMGAAFEVYNQLGYGMAQQRDNRSALPP